MALQESTTSILYHPMKYKPNIIIILADDMGYGDAGCYNSDSKIPTPNMNYLAESGMIFTDAHSASAVCTPSRYGLLTGRYCWRTPLKRQVLFSYEPPLIETDRLTLAGLLKKKHYNTACIGKWHLGLGFTAKKGMEINFRQKLPWPDADRLFEEKIDYSKGVSGGPVDLGFDYFFGTSGCSTCQPPFGFIEDRYFVEMPNYYNELFPGTGRPGMTAPGWENKKVDTTFTRKAVEYISGQKNKKNPFFLYLAVSAPHEPCVDSVVPEFARGKSDAGPRGDLVWLFDWMVGEVVNELKKINQFDNTLIFVTSDNGALPGDRVLSPYGKEVFHTYNHKSCGDLRGYKSHIWEGGHREPLIVHWPDKIKEGCVSDSLFCLNDIFATSAGLLGLEIPENTAKDSFDYAQLLLDQGSYAAEDVVSAAREYLIHHSGGGVFSVRMRNWKLIHETSGSGESYGPGPVTGSRGQLYDMDRDPAEEINLFDEKPDIVREMVNILEKCQMKDESTI